MLAAIRMIRFSLPQGDIPLMPFLLASLTLALLLTVVALVRQVRLRRALEALLRRILEHWRSNRAK
jgi:hypothetical protein